MVKFIYPHGNRLCVHFPTLIPSLSQEIIDDYLRKKNFEKLHVDIIELAREQIGKQYQRGTVYTKEQSFDCSSFTQWLYGQKGIRIPRISIDQRDYGIPVSVSEIKAGDLLFTKGYIDYFYDGKEKDSVGHVGIYTGTGSVIHAANKKRGVVEDSLSDFWRAENRGITRYHDHLFDADTIIIPPSSNIEYDVHLRWRILQTVGVTLTQKTTSS